MRLTIIRMPVMYRLSGSHSRQGVSLVTEIDNHRNEFLLSLTNNSIDARQ